MAGIDKLRTSHYGDYNDLRLWCIKHKPELLNSFYEPFMSYGEWYSLQEQQHKRICSKEKKDIEIEEMSLIIAHFFSHEDKYLYWHCPLDFIRQYLEKQCGYKKANWFIKLFWRK